MRIITDPVVDSIAFLIKRFALPPIIKLLYMIVDFVVSSALYLVALVVGQATANKAYERLTSMVC
jgi:E3 ubiquitin-protein ligase MARCH6